MNVESLLRDLKAALALLPKGMAKRVIGSLFGDPRDLLSVMGAWPQLRALLEPHVKAGMVAYAAGILDMDELQAGVQAIVADVLSEG